MHSRRERNQHITDSIEQVRQILQDGVNVKNLERAKEVMLKLASRVDLFHWGEFPLPRGEEIFRTFLVHQDDDGGYALYVNSSLPGQQSPPHDHGGSWAIVAAVEGEELHRLYRKNGGTGDPDTPPVSLSGEILVEPGRAISMLPEGIHSIEMLTDEPLLHLHLYARGFEFQGERSEYDLKTGEVKCFKLEEVGLIEDAR